MGRTPVTREMIEQALYRVLGPARRHGFDAPELYAIFESVMETICSERRAAFARRIIEAGAARDPPEKPSDLVDAWEVEASALAREDPPTE